jgi:catechol 2,3-dioxygenase-like lactoylglutathione lyase family enzyme
MKTFGSATTFHVSNVEDSLRFYTEVLGFKERFRFGDYAGVEHGDIQIHLSGPAATNKKQIGQGSIYIFCDDVDSYYLAVTSRGAVTQAAPKDYEYGMRDFVIEDLDQNLVGIGQKTTKEG